MTTDVGIEPRFVRRFCADRMGVVSALIILSLTLAAVIGWYFSPGDPNAQDIDNVLVGPSWKHLLGTDALGRDVLARLISGAHVSLVAGVGATAVAALIGLPTGVLAGFRGGVLDVVLSRLADAFLSMPGLILAIAVMAVSGTGLFNVVMAVGILFWPRIFRVARVQTRSIRNDGYVDAARSYGASRLRILTFHIAPNIAPAIIVQAAFLVGLGILAEASLSFIGLGVEAPQASWGLSLQDGYQNLYSQPLLVLWPALLITAAVWASSSLADALRDAMSPESATSHAAHDTNVRD